MEKVKLFYDRDGNPRNEYICEETGDEVILMKNKSGNVIGFEKLNYKIPVKERLHFSFETMST